MDREIKTGVIVGPLGITLEKGVKVLITIYHGTSSAIAEEVFNYLEQHKQDKTPVPISGTDMAILIEDGIIETIPDFLIHSTKYKIILKGELI